MNYPNTAIGTGGVCPTCGHCPTCGRKNMWPLSQPYIYNNGSAGTTATINKEPDRAGGE